MTIAVLGLSLPLLWFGFWIPVLTEMGRRRSIPKWACVCASVGGPIGAAVLASIPFIQRGVKTAQR